MRRERRIGLVCLAFLALYNIILPESAERGSAARATRQRAAPSSDLDAPGRRDGKTVKERTTETCTTVLVGKGLTEKGNLLHAHNEDLWFDTAQNLLSEPARTVDPASDERFYHVSVPYGVTSTLALMGSYNFNIDNVPGDIGLGINENGVMITTNTGHARPEELGEPPAPFVYSDFIRYALERAQTASEAVDLIGAAVEDHGISGDPGLMFFISDPQEGWLVEATPRHWAAVRCPDDGYLARANRYGITTAGDRRSPTLLSDAIDSGWYEPADPGNPEDGFSFRDVYGDPEWNSGPYVDYNKPREEAAQDHLAGLTAGGGKVSAEELLPLLRSHFEGTSHHAEPPHDRAEDVDYTGETARRTVCTARTVISLVAEEDDTLPAGMMARWWTALPAPCTGGYFPIYLAHLGQPFPASYTNAAVDGTPRPDINAWWAHAALVSAVDQDYPGRHPGVRAAFDAFESDILGRVTSLEADASALYAAGKAAEADALLNGFTDDRASAAFEETKRLAAEIRAPRPADEDSAGGGSCRLPAGRPARLQGAAWLALAGVAPLLRARRQARRSRAGGAPAARGRAILETGGVLAGGETAAHLDARPIKRA
ncbi:MAG TPA: C69 family dipeptidase [Sorangium sp.]|nr:C69 family dipeptidase [Sorangium sp.]